VRSVERYFLLLSLKTVATTASPPSPSRTFKAARRFAPLLIPTPRPWRASRCARMIASPSSTLTISSSS